MSCKVCTTVPLGATFRMVSSDSGATCVHCHQLIEPFFPQLGEYVGFSEDGRHEFRLLNPFPCPSCSTLAEKAWCECDDNGGYYEVTTYQQSETLLPFVQEQPELLLRQMQLDFYGG